MSLKKTQGRVWIYFCEVLRYKKTAFLNRISRFFRLVRLTDYVARRARRIEELVIYVDFVFVAIISK